MSFDQLGLTPELLRAVAAQGYTEPTPVQAEAVPHVLAGRDVLAGAQTGTGKTAAFVLPILQLLNAKRPAPRHLPVGNGRPRGATGMPIRCLVLTPTRELALQVEESVRTYGVERPIRSTTIYGGVGFDPQVRQLRAGQEIVVATPGRLLDHAGQGTIDLGAVEILVLDEADRMLDMGFIRDIRRILSLLPAKRQNLLFSATFSNDIRDLAGAFLDDPAQVQIARRNAPIELVRQVVYPVDRERKRELLSHLIRSGRIDRALVFTRTKHGANRLAEQLERDGIVATAIHGNKSQGQRVRALNDFKEGRAAILVATELAARGLDIEELPHVVNFELPMVAADYVHRIGRTGRAGLEGDAISLVCVDEQGLLRDIENLLREPIARRVVPGFEVDRSIRPEAIRQRSNGGPRSMVAGRSPVPARSGAGARPNGVRPPRPAGRANGERPPMGNRPYQPTAQDARHRPGGTPRPAGAVRPNGPRPHAQPYDRHSGARPATAGQAEWSGRGPGPTPGRPGKVHHRSMSSQGLGNRPLAADRADRGRRPGRFQAMPGEKLARAGRRP